MYKEDTGVVDKNTKRKTEKATYYAASLYCYFSYGLIFLLLNICEK